MYRILLIDDEITILNGLKTIITDYFPGEFQVFTASDGYAALSYLQHEYFHIIISDNKMPRLDGLSLLSMIRDNKIDSFVIMLSGFDEYTYIRTAMKLGVHDYLLKPVNVKEFVSLIQELLPQLSRMHSLPSDHAFICSRSQSSAESGYFDVPVSGTPYSVSQLHDRFSDLQQALLSMDLENTVRISDDIFTHISPLYLTKAQFQEMLNRFIYSSIENHQPLIRIISKHKLTNYDISSKIRNLPNLSQLQDAVREILSLYIKELTEISLTNNEYVVKKVKKYINANYQQEINLSALAALFRLNPNYFSTLFKSLTGITIRDYICQVRIENAMRLLRKPDVKILDVALSVGYQDAAHFTRAFKRQTGMSPSTYRQTMLQEDMPS